MGRRFNEEAQWLVRSGVGDKGLHRDEILNAYRLLRTLLGPIRGKTLPHSSTPGERKRKINK